MEFQSGNIFIRPWKLETGERILGHQHRFDHTSIVFTGAVHIRARYVYRQFTCAACATVFETRQPDADACVQCGHPTVTQTGEREELLAERDCIAPWYVLIKADVDHEIIALEPSDFWCVYAHRDPQGTVTQEWDGWTAAYQ